MESAKQSLRTLLISLFQVWEFRSFLRYDPRGQSIEPFLPSGDGSPAEFVDAAIDALARRGLLDKYFFERLKADYPNRAREIEQVERLIVSPPTNAQPQPDASAARQPFPPCDVLLVTATSTEIRSLLTRSRSETKQNERARFGRHTYLYLGEIQETHVYAVRSEMGIGTPGGSLLTIRNSISELKPAVVIMVGIAFGLKPGSQLIGDVLVSRQLHHYAPVRVGTSPDGSPRVIPRGSRVDCTGWVLDRFNHADTARQRPAHFGLLLSGEALVDNLEFRSQLLVREPEAIGGEMEGAGLYAAAWDTQTPWIVVKSICDWGDGQKSQGETDNQSIAAESACDFTFAALLHGGFSPYNRPRGVS